jgi:hypothetical protein
MKKMPEKDPQNTAYIVEWFRSVLPYISTVFLSAWGGVVHHIQRMRTSKTRFNWRELLFDITVSSFAGLLTYFLCQAAEIEGPKAAFLIAISGHMGTRAIASFQALHERIFAKEPGAK